MKEEELREHAECDFCHKKIGEANIPIFYVVKLTQYGIELGAAQRQQGLGLMIGAPLAMVMGANEDLAKAMYTHEKTVCFSCQDRILELMDQE